jgi:cytochrome c556
MTRTVLLTTALAIGVTAAVAQGDPIAERKNLMKENGAVTRTGTQMARGEAPYDPAKAREVFQTYVKVADRMPRLFPENSKTGGDTAALPKIWENMADVRAKFAKFESDAKAGLAATGNLDSFKTALGQATQNCGGCHETYRAKRN